MMMKSITTTLLMTMMLSLLIMMTSKKSIMDMQKMSPFECGFNPMSKKRLPFSTHFFMIAIVFLIFDVEIIIVMPMIMTIKSSMIKYWTISTFTIISMLTMSLYYEWNKGLLNWTK